MAPRRHWFHPYEDSTGIEKARAMIRCNRRSDEEISAYLGMHIDQVAQLRQTIADQGAERGRPRSHKSFPADSSGQQQDRQMLKDALQGSRALLEAIQKAGAA
jgi:hypothetical protein